MPVGYGNKTKEIATGVIAIGTTDTVFVGSEVNTQELNGFVISNLTNGAVTFDLKIGGVALLNDVSIAANSVFMWDFPLLINRNMPVHLSASAGSSLVAYGNVIRKF